MVVFGDRNKICVMCVFVKVQCRGFVRQKERCELSRPRLVYGGDVMFVDKCGGVWCGE